MIRDRKLFGVPLRDCWFDTAGFLASDTPLALLHTAERLDESSYTFAIAEETYSIDLAKSLDDLFAAFDKRSARYPIRKAERDGVTVALAETEEEAERFLRFFQDFAVRKKIPAVRREELPAYDVFFARAADGRYLGGCAFVKADDKSVYRYKHGATTHEEGANDLLIWSAIRYAKIQGYAHFDLGGVTMRGRQASRERFKRKFGGDLTSFFTYVRAKPPLSYLFAALGPIVRTLFKGDYADLISALSSMRMLR